MNSIKKIMLAAGLFLQLTGTVDASYNLANWTNAFLALGGGNNAAVAAQNVLNSPNSVGVSLALKVTKNLGTEEAMAVGKWMSSTKKGLFSSSYQASDVEAAGQAIINNSRSAAKAVPAEMPAANEQSGGFFGGMFGGSSSAADVEAAQYAQQQMDTAAAAANSQALAGIVQSGATGADLYNAYVDLILGSLEQAINAIADANVQQQVVRYAQNKVSSIRASVQANNKNSRVLGKITSKKEVKKHKKSKK